MSSTPCSEQNGTPLNAARLGTNVPSERDLTRDAVRVPESWFAPASSRDPRGTFVPGDQQTEGPGWMHGAGWSASNE